MDLLFALRRGDHVYCDGRFYEVTKEPRAREDGRIELRRIPLDDRPPEPPTEVALAHLAARAAVGFAAPVSRGDPRGTTQPRPPRPRPGPSTAAPAAEPSAFALDAPA